MALTQVSGGGIKDGSITNADLDSSAAIDGSKVSPDFSDQNITTTGTATAAALIPSGSTVPANGVYLPSENTVALATNTTQKFTIDNLDGNPVIENNFPTIRPSLDLAFALTKSLDPRITFTRASEATYVDDKGVIQIAVNNQPRFDHDPTTGESLGLLVEESRTNLLLQSEDLTTTWTNGASSINSNTITALDGTVTADALIDTVDNSPHNVTQSVAGVSGNTSYTFSCWMKKGSKDYGALIFGPNTSWGDGSSTSAFFNLVNGTVSSTSNATATIQAFPDGWYRCTATASTIASPGTVLMRISSSLNGTAQTYVGDADEAIYIWGAQLEVGSFPTSYIPTEGSAITRAADVASITGSNFSSWYRQDEGTVFADIVTSSRGHGAYPRLVCFIGSDINAVNELSFYTRNVDGANDYKIFGVANDGTTNGYFDPPIASPVGYARAALAVKENDGAMSINGLSTVTDNTLGIPTPTQLLLFASVRYQPASSGYLKRLTYWPARLPDETLQTLTK